MRFFGALFLGVCYANVAERSAPVLTTLIPEVANPPKETQASVEARLALVAVCPEATANCSVPTGQEAENEELADALDCMLKVDINTIPPGPCHDALKKFLDDHLNPSNRAPQGPPSPTVLIMRSQPGPSPLAEILQRMAANSRPMPMPMPMPQPMMFPFQDPRFQQEYPQNYPMGPDRGQSRAHGFPPMFSRRMDDYDEMRYQGRGRTRNSRNSRNRAEEDGHWDLVWHSTRDEPSRGSSRMSSHHMPPPPPRHVSSSRGSRMSAPSRYMPSSHMSSRMPPQHQASLSSQRGSSRMSSSSSSMNPMMMLLPHLMRQGSSQNPMSGILMATMMKNMASNSYDYDYDYSYDYNDEDDYDYDYDYEDESEPSPLASMIRKMLQQKLASRQATVQVSLDPTMIEPVTIVDSPLEVSSEDPVEIQPSRARSDKEIRIEQVSYRSAP